MFLIPEKQQKTMLNFSLNSLIATEIIYTMEQQKILSLLNRPIDSKFVKREVNIVNYQSNANYDVGNEIIYNTKI